MNAIPCLTWVKRGVAKAHPDKLRNVDLSQDAAEEEDLEEDSDEESEEEEWDTEDEEDAEKEAGSADASDEEENDDDDIKEKYNMSDYDGEEDQVEDDGTAPMSLKGLACFSSNQEDPYIAKGDDSDADEDLEIRPDDNLILMGKYQRDYSGLNVYVYNEKNNYLYCHHDSLLLGFPLCMEWMDFDPGEQRPGNLVAVGYMEPDIEIWDVDVLDSIEPAFVLKGSKKNKKKATGHRDAVLDLSWNPQQRNVIASASADQTIGLWDLMKGKIVVSLTDHEDKVQTVKWHPVEAETLLSGAFDKSIKIHDVRTPENAIKSMSVSGEVEKVIWDTHNPFCFLASCDDGSVHYFDTRNTKNIFKLQAHDDAVCGMCLSPSVAGCLVTVSPDKLVKVWDIRGSEPEQVFAKELQIGELHSLGVCPDSPMMFAVGGDREMRVLNLQKHNSVTSHFDVEYIGKEKDDEWEVAQSDKSEDEDAEMDPKEMLKGWQQTEGKRAGDEGPGGKSKKKKIKGAAKNEEENVEPDEDGAADNEEQGKGKKRKRKRKKKSDK